MSTQNENTDYKKLLKYCYEHATKINLSNQNDVKIYDTALAYLMSTKFSNWTKEDVLIILCFLTQKTIIDNNLNCRVSVNMLDEDNYRTNPSRYERNNNESISYIIYPKVMFSKLEGSPSFYGIQSIFKEISFVMIDKSLQEKQEFNKHMYIMALENILRQINPNLYYQLSNNLFRESQANLYGYNSALKFIQIYNENLYKALESKRTIIEQDKKKYRSVFSNEEFFLSLDFNNSFRTIDSVVSIYIKEHPELIIKYPILSVGYKNDGSKKNIVELIIDRNTMLLNNKDKGELDALYYTLCNYKDYDIVDENGAKGECEKIINYMYQLGDIDDFVLELLKHRLQFTGDSESKVDDFILNIKRETMIRQLKRLKQGI